MAVSELTADVELYVILGADWFANGVPVQQRGGISHCVAARVSHRIANRANHAERHGERSGKLCQCDAINIAVWE